MYPSNAAFHDKELEIKSQAPVFVGRILQVRDYMEAGIAKSWYFFGVARGHFD